MTDIFVTEEKEQERLNICSSCDNNKDFTDNVVVKFVEKFGISAPEAAKQVCGLCMCPVKYKVKKSHMECPAGKWWKA